MNEEQRAKQLLTLNELRADAKMMKVHADSIRKTVNAISIEYLPFNDLTDKEDSIWQVKITPEKFNEIFIGQPIVLTNRGCEGGCPFKKYITTRSIIIGDVQFFCLLETRELTKLELEESAKWIADTLKA